MCSSFSAEFGASYTGDDVRRARELGRRDGLAESLAVCAGMSSAADCIAAIKQAIAGALVYAGRGRQKKLRP